MPGNELKGLENLRELARIIGRVGPKYANILTESVITHSSTRLAVMFRAITQQGNLDELISQRQVLSKTKPTSFEKLKSRLRAQTLATLFHLDLSRGNFSEYSLKLYDLNRQLFIVRVLVSLNARVPARSIAKRSLKKALALEDWIASMQFLSVLRTHAAGSGNQRSHKKYIAEYQRCKNLFEHEQDATITVELLQLEFARSASEKPEHARIADEVAVRLESATETTDSFHISFLRLRLLAIASQIRLDYSQTLTICESAFKLLSKYPLFATNSRHAEFAIMRLVSAVQSRQDAIANQAIEQCKKYLPREVANWFVYKEWHVLYLMHGLKFHEAAEVTRSILSHRSFFTLPDPAKEKWQVYMHYAKYVTGEVVEIQNPAEVSSIAPLFRPDKSGLNTSMVLLHILLLCEDRRFSDLRERAEFIKGYRKRFLKGETSSHSSLLFQMLGMIETCDLNYRKVVKKSALMLEELNRIELEEPIQGIQLLPYTWVWNRVLTRLKEYHHLSHQTS